MEGNVVQVADQPCTSWAIVLVPLLLFSLFSSPTPILCQMKTLPLSLPIRNSPFPGIAAHAFHPSTPEADASRSREFEDSLLYRMRPYLWKRKRKSFPSQHPHVASFQEVFNLMKPVHFSFLTLFILCFAWMCVWSVCACSAHSGQKRAADLLKTEVPSDCEPPCGPRNKTWVLWKSSNCSSFAEPSLQPLIPALLVGFLFG